jgi:2-polyprenyl-6-hydroxyphenyl methylase/3-demethylubiquinone-9 3-methyltransferase
MQFDFGQNWVRFSKAALTPEKAEQARRDFLRLFEGIDLAGRTFLDIGFGQGLGLIAAQKAGARVFGTDINPKCREALALSASVLGISLDVPVVIGSILDKRVLFDLAGCAPPRGTFSIVHSWGVLHHTGDMQAAIENASSLVDDDGHFVIAIYNRHWSSPLWRVIKRLYCCAPAWSTSVLTAAFFPVIALAKFLVTGKNPFVKNRGMDFYYDVADWIGGYPYEYASRADMVRRVERLGFTCVRVEQSEVPTGCNEFVFKKTARLAAR